MTVGKHRTDGLKGNFYTKLKLDNIHDGTRYQSARPNSSVLMAIFPHKLSYIPFLKDNNLEHSRTLDDISHSKTKFFPYLKTAQVALAEGSVVAADSDMAQRRNC